MANSILEGKDVESDETDIDKHIFVDQFSGKILQKKKMHIINYQPSFKEIKAEMNLAHNYSFYISTTFLLLGSSLLLDVIKILFFSGVENLSVDGSMHRYLQFIHISTFIGAGCKVCAILALASMGLKKNEILQ